MFRKTDVDARILRAIENYPEKTYVPVHPSDYYALRFEGRLNSFPVPLYCLGTGGYKKPIENQ